MKKIELYSHQKLAIEKLKTGSILVGGVGSGKSLTALTYYFVKVCHGEFLEKYSKPKDPKNLYIITTARKRDTHEWEEELIPFMLSTDIDVSVCGIKVVIDSWNNIEKYSSVKNSFFIFDEQRVVGYGAWSKAFIKISKSNRWILLSATPGDTWMDYVSVFIANGFYPNKTAFERRHVVYSRFAKYPKVERYVGVDILEEHRRSILVQMPDNRPTISHHTFIHVPYDKELSSRVLKERWDVFRKEPIRDAGSLCLILRRIANAEPKRLEKAIDIVKQSKKCIIFYNFNYELEMLKEALDAERIVYAEWNGHRHEDLPTGERWAYLVQYTAGAEGWNCISTDTVLFYSQNYSYKIMQQAAGRIDRMNTPFVDLYYYHLMSSSPIDIAIKRAIDTKKNFNERAFYESI